MASGSLALPEAIVYRGLFTMPTSRGLEAKLGKPPRTDQPLAAVLARAQGQHLPSRFRGRKERLQGPPRRSTRAVPEARHCVRHLHCDVRHQSPFISPTPSLVTARLLLRATTPMHLIYDARICHDAGDRFASALKRFLQEGSQRRAVVGRIVLVTILSLD
jgi:hypothetical protein